MKHIRQILVVAVVGVCIGMLASYTVSALDVPPKPTDVPIVDQTNTLTAEQKASLAAKIADERKKSGNQIAIVMVPTLADESLEDYSLDIARQWGIGTSENNNGILLFVAKDDKRLRIEVGRGLEGALTDVQSNRIISNQITPQFRQGRYYEGIAAGLSSIIAAIHGEYTAADTEPAPVSSFPWEAVLVFGFIGFSWLGSVLARTKSWWAGGVVGGVAGGAFGLITASLVTGIIGVVVLAVLGLLFDKAVSSNYQTRARRGDAPSWWAGGTTLGGGSSGGFGGFGGGGFGGGGSSGSW